MKVCVKCQQVKPLDSFPRRARRGNPDAKGGVCRECVNLRERKWRAKKERVTYLPVEPFRQWLEERLPNYETSEDFAFALGAAERRIWEWRHRSEKVSLVVVDRVLTHEGSTALEELYPFDEYQ